MTTVGSVPSSSAVLPAPLRIHRSREFTEVLDRGARAGTPTLVVHCRTDEASTEPARAGFVVGRTVGTAVTRNRVRRRLRHLVAARLSELPPGTRLVVRALPAAAAAPSRRLEADLHRGLERLRGRDATGRGAVR